MAWRFVKQPNGLLCIFDESTDKFNGYNMTIDESLSACVDIFEMKKYDSALKVRRSLLAEETEPLGRWNDAVNTARHVHGDNYVNEVVYACSTSSAITLGELPDITEDFKVKVRGELTEDSATFIVNSLQLSNGDWRYAESPLFSSESIKAAKGIESRIKKLSETLGRAQARAKAQVEFITKHEMTFLR